MAYPGGYSVLEGPDGKAYPAFSLHLPRYPGGATSAKAAVSLLGAAGQEVVQLQTKQGLTARIQMQPAPGDQLDLMAASLALHQAAAEPVQSSYDKVRIPMVKLKQQPDVSWLERLTIAADSGHWWLAEALMQTRFAMNQYGALVKEEFAAAVALSAVMYQETPFVVDKPFLITIGDLQVEAPAFGAYITPSHWEDPGELDTVSW